MKKKNKILVAASVLSILAVGGVAVGTTTALFNDTASSSVHINAGKLEMGFYMKSIVVDTLDATTGEVLEDQTLDLANDDTYKDYYEANKGVDLKLYTAALFTIDNVFPSMKGTITLLVENNSKIAVDATCVTTHAGEWASGTAMTTDELAKFTVSSDWTTSAQINKDGTKEAVISFEFKADADNTYQSAKFTIDSVLTATQVTAQHS